MGSPNLSTKNCNPAPLPLPNNNTVIILGICIEFLYENILLHFPWKVIKTHFIHSWFICVHFSCLIRALLLKHGLLIKNILYRLSYSFSSFSPCIDDVLLSVLALRTKCNSTKHYMYNSINPNNPSRYWKKHIWSYVDFSYDRPYPWHCMEIVKLKAWLKMTRKFHDSPVGLGFPSRNPHPEEPIQAN